MIENLTNQELKILKLLCFERKTIAEKLVISVHTVNSYINCIYKKLMVNNPQSALIQAVKNGFITFDDIEIYGDQESYSHLITEKRKDIDDK